MGARRGRRLRRSVYGATQREVRDAIRRLNQERAGGVDIAERPATLAEFLERWLEVWEDRVRPSTLSFYRYVVRKHIAPALGRIQLDELTALHVETLVYDRSRSALSPRSRKAILDVLRISLNHAVRSDLIARNVALNVLPPRQSRKPVAYLDPGQARRLLEAARDDSIGPLVVLCLTTGLRQGEALALRWREVDLHLGTVTVVNAIQRQGGKGLQLVEPKTARSRRRLILPAVALAALRQQLDRQPGNGEARRAVSDGFVFTAGNGQPLDASNVRRSFERLLARAEVPRIRFHDLRHSAATLLLAEGVHPRVVMDVLGHSQISMTLNTYSHVIPPLMKDAAVAMDRALEGSESDRSELAR